MARRSDGFKITTYVLENELENTIKIIERRTLKIQFELHVGEIKGKRRFGYTNKKLMACSTKLFENRSCIGLLLPQLVTLHTF